MKIQDGCDRYCSYCIIPYARGHLRSKSLEAIREEAVCLSENGYKEVVLTGINLSYFGRGMGLDIGDAVLAVAEVEGIKRIRLGSLQPDLISDEIIEKFVHSEKLCPQFHLSLQSGSSTVLKRMNRPYTSEVFSDVVKRLRKAFPGLSITTDIIVGFPGETDKEFSETAEFIKEIGFSKVHIFPYSKRSGTPAAEMDCQVPETVKNERKKVLSVVAEEVRKAEMEKLIGKEVGVLVERRGEGYSENYTPVSFKGDLKTGEIVRVKITKINNGKAEGEIV
jgi:threonylcarbamoyladenosine tRNA methylthiotransferase MtaB